MVQHVMNKTMGYSMARFTVAVTPEEDIDKVGKIIDKIGLDLAAEEDWQNKVLEAPHYVMMGEFTSTAVNLIVSGKTQPSDQWSVIAEMRRRILDAFEREAIAIGATPVMAAAGKKTK
jgi:small conductance mechanosensitive channel